MKSDGRVRVTTLDWISLVLVIVGALNWGLVGVGLLVNANWNVVAMLFSSIPVLEAVIYILVGLAGIYELYFAGQLYNAREAGQRSRGTIDD